MLSKVKNEVYWYRGLKSFSAPLKGKIASDVVIIGGGMAGLMAGQLLSQNGKSVVIVEKGFCGAGASGRTSGFITPDSEIELSSLIEKHGPEEAQRIWGFVLSGVESIRKNILEHQIACDYQIQDSLFVANNKSASQYPYQEHKIRQQLNYASYFYQYKELLPLIGSKGYVAAVRYPDTFGINSYQYCQGLKEVLLKAGVRIYENTPAISIDSYGIKIPEGSIDANHIVVATDRFIPELGKLKNEIYHVQTFLGISSPLKDEEVSLIFPKDKMMVWDTDLVYNYYRITGDNRILLGGGDMLYTYAKSYAVNVNRFAERLEKYFHKKFPSVRIELEYLWPGMLGVSKDLLPIMGPDKHNAKVWYVGAATGLPWAASLGRYAAERILNGRSDFDLRFSPERKFIIGDKAQHLLSTPLSYALSHGVTKYIN